MDVIIRTPTAADQAEFDACGFNIDLSQYVKVDVGDGTKYGFVFIKSEDYDRLGYDYISAHAALEENHIGDEKWRVVISQNDWYNDLTRNPERVIPVRFVKTENGTGREIYRGLENDRYYARENYYPRECCAKWYCYGGSANAGDGNLPRPNTVFVCDGQREKVTYDDWNDVMAYSETFNKDFNRLYPD